MSSSNRVRVTLLEEVNLGETPVDTQATRIVQDLTYLSKLIGELGNDISIAYIGGGTAGSEVVTVTDEVIEVEIESGVSTASQIKDAIEASVEANALVEVVVSGTGSTAQVSAGAVNLQGGISRPFLTARFINESLSGSPGTTESQQIRADRQPSGQVVTSLEVGGELGFELAKENVIDRLIAAAMLSEWSEQALQTVGLTIDATAKTITRDSGDWAVTLDVGDFVQLGGFTSSLNNIKAQLLEIVSPTVARFNFGGNPVDGTGVTTTYKRADRVSIGTTKKSFSMEKAFLDLDQKAINYRGMLVNEMSLEINYGEIINGSFTFNGTDYEPVEASANFLTEGRTIVDPATSNSMNGSIDMPIISSELLGTLTEVEFCIQNISIGLNNNMTVQNCIGEIAPKDYSPGTAAVEVSLSTYLADDNWTALALKLSQQPFAVSFLLNNIDGSYGFFMPAVQVSFDDPASAGANQEVSLEMEGVARVGSQGESALFIYKF
jgi:hypothetical protein